jgi:hypothetical protein
MTPTIEDSNKFGTLSESRLADFEKNLGYRLPEDYRKYLLSHNGGTPNPGFFTSEYWGELSVDVFYGFHDGPYWTRLEPALVNWTESLPLGYLPIGCDIAGNAICISLFGDSRGALFLGEVHGRLDVNQPCDTPIFDWLAPSFQELLNMLAHETSS